MCEHCLGPLGINYWKIDGHCFCSEVCYREWKRYHGLEWAADPSGQQEDERG